MRYMGTKRHMVDQVRHTIDSLDNPGRVVDLFAGIGTVAESLACSASVVTNDAMAFSAGLARAKFLGVDRSVSPAEMARALRRAYMRHHKRLSDAFVAELERETTALDAGRADLAAYIEAAPHVGNSRDYAQRAQAASRSVGQERYILASIYFSAGYLSLRQAIDVDAIRYAIDLTAPAHRDWLLAAWLDAVSVVLNAPGHTAQFLHPNTDTSYHRIERIWRRSVWDTFSAALATCRQVGTAAWREDNEVHNCDALDLVEAQALANIGVVYADPPYTKDQYSRFYHLYETLYLYDFPSSSGAGRVRSDRFSTGFSLKSSVVSAFHDLCRSVSRMGTPLVISYPSDGLVVAAGSSVRAIAEDHFETVNQISLSASHSTLGASKGASKKAATENIYVCSN